MKYIMLDTRVLLDIATKKSSLPLILALEEMISSGNTKLIRVADFIEVM